MQAHQNNCVSSNLYYVQYQTLAKGDFVIKPNLALYFSFKICPLPPQVLLLTENNCNNRLNLLPLGVKISLKNGFYKFFL